MNNIAGAIIVLAGAIVFSTAMVIGPPNGGAMLILAWILIVFGFLFIFGFKEWWDSFPAKRPGKDPVDRDAE